MPTNFVKVKNPANGMVSDMPEKAFENTFKDKGFTLVDEDEVTSGETNTSDEETEDEEPKPKKKRTFSLTSEDE